MTVDPNFLEAPEFFAFMRLLNVFGLDALDPLWGPEWDDNEYWVGMEYE